MMVSTLRKSRSRAASIKGIYSVAGEPLNNEKYPMLVPQDKMKQHPKDAKFYVPLHAIQYAWLNIGMLLAFYNVFSQFGSVWTPCKFALHLALAYVAEMVFFACVHLPLHAAFATRFPIFIHRPEHVQYGMYIAWKHHYVDIRTFTANWLAYRVAYVDFFSFVPYDHAFSVSALYLSALYHATIPVSACWLLYDALCSPVSNKHCGMICVDIQLMFLARHFQAVLHEWYHVPKSQLDANQYFYLPFIGPMFAFFEYVGLIDYEQHKDHHADDFNALTMADSFFDSYIPDFFDRMVTNYWVARVAEYKPRELIGTPELLSDPGHEAATQTHPFRERINRDCTAMGILNMVFFYVCFVSLNTYW